MKTLKLKNIILIAVSICVSLLLLVSALFSSAVMPAKAYTETAFFTDNSDFNVTYDYNNQFYSLYTDKNAYGTNGLYINKDTSNVNEISFDFSMTEVASHSYFPTISFMDKSHNVVTFQFCSWVQLNGNGHAFMLKHSEMFKNLKSIPYDVENHTFDGKITIQPNGRTFKFLINGEEFHTYTLGADVEYEDDTHISFGLQHDFTKDLAGSQVWRYNIPNYSFSNIRLDIENAPVLSDLETETTYQLSPLMKLLSILCIIAFVYVILYFVFRYLVYGDKKKNK